MGGFKNSSIKTSVLYIFIIFIIWYLIEHEPNILMAYKHLSLKLSFV